MGDNWKVLMVTLIAFSACVTSTEIEFESEFFNDYREFSVKVPINLYGSSYTNLVVSKYHFHLMHFGIT